MGTIRSPKLEQMLSDLKDLDPDTYPAILEAITKLMSARSLQAAESHSLLELRGLGKDLWEGVDIEDYIKRERDSWS